MKTIRLLPVVILAVAALLVLKTVGLVTNGAYVLTGATAVLASGAESGGGEAAPAEGGTDPTMSSGATMEDTSPTLVDPTPTLAAQTAPEAGAAPGGGHGAAEGEALPALVPEGEAAAASPTSSGTYCIEADATVRDDGSVRVNSSAAAGEAGAAPDTGAVETAAPAEPSFAQSMTDCLPSGDAVPLSIDGKGGSVPLITADGSTLSEQQLLERLAARRTQLEQYEQDLTLRASIVDAAEKRIEERAATLAALEAQISALVDQRQQMESGQFAGIVAMYETMKPKDAANIFNNLEMDVLLRVAKLMSPRKMAPILAGMEAARAQELTVKMAALSDQPATQMTPDDLAALPQIVGQ